MYILGNWKMNGEPAGAATLAKAVADYKAPDAAIVALFPPALLLSIVAQSVKGSAVAVGAQDVSPYEDGAYTGDISASQLKGAGCEYVIIGHSERRGGHNETDDLVRRKAEAALNAGLIPIVCVGESLEQRESGKYLDIITTQVRNSLPRVQGKYIIAYEPCWAIGTGKTATLQDIAEAHKTIANVASSVTSGAPAAIVYGGSVKAANAASILNVDGVNGVLVGGASLKAEEFCGIIAAAQKRERSV